MLPIIFVSLDSTLPIVGPLFEIRWTIERLSSWRVSKRGGNAAKVDRSSPRYIIELFSCGRFDSTPGIRDEKFNSMANSKFYRSSRTVAKYTRNMGILELSITS